MVRVAVTGASGLVGSALSRALVARGDEVVRLVRREPEAAGERRWVPGGVLDPVVLADVDAVVHLAGAGVGDKRWTAEYRKVIRRSRIDGTRTLARAVEASGRDIRVVSGSAVGVYGSDRGDEVLTERSPAGRGFLADVVRAWEGEMRVVEDRVPVAYARTGIVLTATGGAMGRLLPLARLGLGGPLGDGQQFWPIITLVDEVAALLWLLDHRDVVGPVNLVAPGDVRQGQFAALLADALGRPAILPAPAFAIRAALGGLADDIVGSQRIHPQVLVESGFEFTHPDGESAARWLAAGEE